MTHDNRRLKRKVRNSYIVSTVSISMVLFLLGAVGYLIFNALGATGKMRESVAMHVMLKHDISEQSISEIGKRLGELEEVRDIVFVSKDEAAEEFKEYIGSDFTDFLDFNPLPDSYEVRLNAADMDNDVVAELDRRISQWPEVSEVVYQRNVIEQIGSKDNINKFNLVLLVFGAALLFISLVLLNNTIRVTIFSKRYIINTMKLVGATKWFVMKPFLKSSILQGIYSAFIASLMLAGLIMGIREKLPELNFINDNIYILWIIAGMFVVGVMISLLFTIFAVNKFVKMHTDAVNFY